MEELDQFVDGDLAIDQKAINVKKAGHSTNMGGREYGWRRRKETARRRSFSRGYRRELFLPENV